MHDAALKSAGVHPRQKNLYNIKDVSTRRGQLKGSQILDIKFLIHLIWNITSRRTIRNSAKMKIDFIFFLCVALFYKLHNFVHALGALILTVQIVL